MAPSFEAIDDGPTFRALPKIPVRRVLADSKGVMRLSEVVEKAQGPEESVREELERLAEEGEVTLGEVGEHTMVRAEGELREETKDRSGRRSDKCRNRVYEPRDAARGG